MGVEYRRIGVTALTPDHRVRGVVRGLLNSTGCPVLPYEEQLAHVDAFNHDAVAQQAPDPADRDYGFDGGARARGRGAAGADNAAG